VQRCEHSPQRQELLNSDAGVELRSGCKLRIYDLFPPVK